MDTKMNEDLTTAAEPNVADTDEILSVGDMFQQVKLPSLGRSIFPVVPISGPTGGLFNIRVKAATNDLELVRSNVEVFPSESIKTGLTQEAAQDIMSQYGLQSRNIIGSLLRGLANDQENTATLAFLDSVSLVDPFLQLTSAANSEMNWFEVSQRVEELVMKMNAKTARTFSAAAVIPYYAMGAVKAQKPWTCVDGVWSLTDGCTTYFLNPDVNSVKAYVVLRDLSNPSKSSGVFSPYTSDIIEATDYESGQVAYHIYNRFAITASPLHEVGNEMFYTFEVLI
jgi:hypothetical protein